MSYTSVPQELIERLQPGDLVVVYKGDSPLERMAIDRVTNTQIVIGAARFRRARSKGRAVLDGRWWRRVGVQPALSEIGGQGRRIVPATYADLEAARERAQDAMRRAVDAFHGASAAQLCELATLLESWCGS